MHPQSFLVCAPKDAFSDLWKALLKGPETLVRTLAFVFEQITYLLPSYALVFSHLILYCCLPMSDVCIPGSQEDFRLLSFLIIAFSTFQPCNATHTHTLSAPLPSGPALGSFHMSNILKSLSHLQTFIVTCTKYHGRYFRWYTFLTVFTLSISSPFHCLCFVPLHFFLILWSLILLLHVSA